MTLNEERFVKFWEEHLKGKVQAETEYVLQAYEILYGVVSQSRCATCLSRMAQEMKDRYHALKNNN